MSALVGALRSVHVDFRTILCFIQFSEAS
jgi:hypothetical protein